MRYETFKNGVLTGVVDKRILETYKLQRIAMLKQSCTDYIEANAPVFKQINASLGIYDSDKNAAIKQVIVDAKAKCDTLEAKINACTDCDGCDQYYWS